MQRLCKNCSKETKNPLFCSRSCSATFNNRIVKRRKKKIRLCKKCSCEIFNRNTLCSTCRSLQLVDWSLASYAEIAKYKYQANSRIRDLARKSFLKSHSCVQCQKCGYDKHIEICHIKAINKFQDTDTVATINSPNNLLCLCPNCHWEFDHGHFTINDIKNLPA